MAIRDSDPQHDAHGGDPVEQQAPPAGTGGADSFDSRHNEFHPSEGQEGAGVDEHTGAAVHDDGTQHERAEEPHPEGFDAEQPRQVDDGEVEPNAEQPRER